MHPMIPSDLAPSSSSPSSSSFPSSAARDEALIPPTLLPDPETFTVTREIQDILSNLEEELRTAETELRAVDSGYQEVSKATDRIRSDTVRLLERQTALAEDSFRLQKHLRFFRNIETARTELRKLQLGQPGVTRLLTQLSSGLRESKRYLQDLQQSGQTAQEGGSDGGWTTPFQRIGRRFGGKDAPAYLLQVMALEGHLGRLAEEHFRNSLESVLEGILERQNHFLQLLTEQPEKYLVS